MTDLLHRLRWANLARVAAVLLALVLIFAWPHLHAAEPSLPPAAAAPLDTTPVEQPTTTVPAAEHKPARTKATPKRKRSRSTAKRRASRARARTPRRAAR